MSKAAGAETSHVELEKRDVQQSEKVAGPRVMNLGVDVVEERKQRPLEK